MTIKGIEHLRQLWQQWQQENPVTAQRVRDRFADGAVLEGWDVAQSWLAQTIWAAVGANNGYTRDEVTDLLRRQP